MKTLRDGWRGLREFGINVLTGDADAYGMRVLCDVNEDGKAFLEGFFGNTVELREGSNWNSTVEGKPAVASIMLVHETIMPLKIYGVFHVLKFPHVIFNTSGDVMGVTDSEWEKNRRIWEDIHYEHLYNYGADRAGVCKDGRNIHQMSGRVS